MCCCYDRITSSYDGYLVAKDPGNRRITTFISKYSQTIGSGWCQCERRSTKIFSWDTKSTQCRSNRVHNKRSSNKPSYIIRCCCLCCSYGHRTSSYNSYRIACDCCYAEVTTCVSKCSTTIGSGWCQSKWQITKILSWDTKSTQRRSNRVHNKRGSNRACYITCGCCLCCCYGRRTSSYNSYRIACDCCYAEVTTCVSKCSTTIGSWWCQGERRSTKILRWNSKSTQRRRDRVNNKCRSSNCARCIIRCCRLCCCYGRITSSYNCYHIVHDCCYNRITTRISKCS